MTKTEKAMKTISVVCILAAFGLAVIPSQSQQAPGLSGTAKPVIVDHGQSNSQVIEKIDSINRKIDLLTELVRKMKQDQEIQQLSEQTEEEQPESVEADCTLKLYTADSMWRCGPCDKQKASLASSPLSVEYETILCPSRGRSPSNTYPTWELTRADGTVEVVSGYLSTQKIEDWVREGR